MLVLVKPHVKIENCQHSIVILPAGGLKGIYDITTVTNKPVHCFNDSESFNENLLNTLHYKSTFKVKAIKKIRNVLLCFQHV